MKTEATKKWIKVLSCWRYFLPELQRLWEKYTSIQFHHQFLQFKLESYSKVMLTRQGRNELSSPHLEVGKGLPTKYNRPVGTV